MAQPTWNTAAGSIGNLSTLIYSEIQLSATAVLPASSLTYSLLSGTLPLGMSLSSSGLISGIPTSLATTETDTFAIRVTDNLNNIKDRTFSITVSSSAVPTITNPPGSLFTTNDSLWIEFPIQYNNPVSSNDVIFTVVNGTLPPGLEMNEAGLIRGYPSAPIFEQSYPAVLTEVTSITGNVLTCLSTSGFAEGRIVTFNSTVFGGLVENTTYYIKTINDSTTFTISTTQFGPELALTTSSGSMNATLPLTTTNSPTIRTYSFSIRLYSALGLDVKPYTITVVNQNTPVSQGGPGFLPNTRVPTILNTRPETFNINNSPMYGYYVLPPSSLGYNDTYPPSVYANIGTFGNQYFSFKVMGYDFDGSNLDYTFENLPSGLTGDTSTGWITGYPNNPYSGINEFAFTVSVAKHTNSTITSGTYHFSYKIAVNVSENVIWNTPSNLGIIFNGTLSTKVVDATADTPLFYTLVSGALPPNLTLLSNGEITGYVADQPTTTLLAAQDETTYSFTIKATSTLYPIISSLRTFTLTVQEKFTSPSDTLYIKASPSIEDRVLIDSLLNNTTIIPDEMLYRPTDVNFGKATAVVYEHAYGIMASSIEQYINAVSTNHYWRNITLGPIKTAVAKDDTGKVLYEVVYSEIVDNLTEPTFVTINAGSFSLGVTYTIKYPGNTDWIAIGATSNIAGTTFTATGSGTGTGTATTISTVTSVSSSIVWPFNITVNDVPLSRTLYPNSLDNMRNKVATYLGQEQNYNLLPLWMTSQQENGSTLGFTKAWVICYTKPDCSVIIKNNIETLWPNTLNEINFKIDRFSVNKSLTYNFDNILEPAVWTALPSATPVPDPIDSKDFYVLFPHKTILP